MADKLVFESPRVTLRIGGRAGARGTPRAARPFPVIVGCPRSGTSLLAVMLDSHPQLAIPPETSFLPHVMALSGDPASLRQRFFDIVTADRMTVSNWSDFGLDKDAFWRRLHAIDAVHGRRRHARVLRAVRRRASDKPRSGEKTPGYVFMMPQIAALLPEAHFIHVIRDPRDTALSWRKTWFAPSQDFRVLGDAWRQHVEAGRRAARAAAALPSKCASRIWCCARRRSSGGSVRISRACLRSGDARFRRARARRGSRGCRAARTPTAR